MRDIDKKIAYVARLGCPALPTAAGIALRYASKSYMILGNMLIGAGAVMLAFCALKTIAAQNERIYRIVSSILACAAIMFCFAFAATEAAVIYSSKTAERAAGIDGIKADYLIVLGAGVEGFGPSDILRFRLNTALEYLKLHPDTICIVSGGYTTSAEMSEAACMSEWLIERGISSERIIEEEKAQDTYQNIKFSYDVINDGSENTVAIVTGDYHVLRTELMAKLQGHVPIMIGADTEGALVKANFYAREVFALWNRLIFGYETI